LVHGFRWLHHAIDGLVANWGWMKAVGSTFIDALVGVAAGAVCVAAWTIFNHAVLEKRHDKN
jgi:hypothetical protein